MQVLWDEERYQLEQLLPSGCFNANAFLVIDTTNKIKKVIKVIGPQRYDPERVNALERLRTLAPNSNTLGLFEFSRRNDHGPLVLIMDYCVGDNLKTLMSRTNAPLSSDRVVDLTYQILKGLAYLHSNNIIHRNLQPRNIFQSWMYGEIRIGMIGVTKIDQLNNDDWGYLSPQMLQNQPYTNKTDIWSLGCIVYELLTLQKAYPGISLFHMINQVLNRPLDLNSIPSELLRGILSRCFEIEEWSRHDTVQVREALLTYQQSLAASSAQIRPGFALNNGRYIIRRVLAEGDFGQVYLADDQRDQTHFRKVIKQISTLQSDRVQIEVNILRNLPRHPNVVAFFDHFMHFSIHILAIEYCNNVGKLSEVIASKIQANQKIPDQDIFNWSIQILNGLEFFHSKDIVHLDVKPYNVFFDLHGVVKLGHHSLARDIHSMSNSHRFLESCHYLCPELYRGDRLSSKMDIWSFGCLLFELYTLQKPYYMERFRDINMEFFGHTFSFNFFSILIKCIQSDPILRPGANYLAAWLTRMSLLNNQECLVLQQFFKRHFDYAANQLFQQSYVIDSYLDATMAYDPVAGLTNNSIQVAQNLRWIGEEYDNQRNYPAAFEYKERARNMYIVLNQQNSKDMAECLVALSKTCHLRGDHTLELDYLIRSYDIYTNQNFTDSNEKAECLMLLGRAYNWNGDHASELRFKSQSYEMYQRLNQDSEETIGIAMCFSELGLAYRFNNDHERELACMRIAYDMYKRLLGNTHIEVAKLAKHLGIAYGLSRQFPRVLYYKQKSVNILEELSGESDNLDLALSYLELAITNVLRGYGDGGMKNIAFGMLRRLNIPDLSYYARYYLSMSRVYELGGQPEAQVQYSLVALNLYEMLNQEGEEILPFLEGLAIAYDNIADETGRRAQDIRNRFLR